MSSIPPQTPERGRCRTRYPSHLSRQLLDDQGRPRPLLHRRGTSHMYETLEDLLKEAGYKETRIFTPEVEQRRDASRKRDMSAVGGAVVKMFSTWMSKKSVGNDDDDKDKDKDTDVSCPPSPLAHRTRAPLSTIKPLQSPSNSSLLTVRPPSSRLRSSTTLQNQHLATSAPPPPSPPTYINSRARLALRHAQSAPHMDKRRARTQPRPSRVSAKAPPLPATWFESLSAALLSPRVTPPTTPVTKRTAPPRKPTVLPHRTPTSVAVTITNVVCRSAPSSRSSSAVRSTPGKNKHKHKHTARAAVPVPTLAQTSVCEEQSSAVTAWPPHSPHHLPHASAAAGALPSRFGTQPIDMDMDDDEDDELNLTMMLIPSKRQHSIRSLRSVLHHHGGMGGCSAPCSTSASAYAYAAYARDEVARVRVMRRRMIEESEDEIMEAEAVSGGGEEGEGHWDSGEFLTAKVKRRRSNLPRQWSWAA